MQEEFRIFFGTDLGAGSGWIVLAEMLHRLRGGCAKAPLSVKFYSVGKFFQKQ